MKETEFYRPAYIEFDVANSYQFIPDTLGKFENAQQATEFIAKNLTATNSKMAANRFMDNFEKNELRKSYQAILEDKVPLVERELANATIELENAKKAHKDSTEYYNATINEARSIANEVKKGIKKMELDQQFTWRVPYDGKYFFYTYIDKQLKLCKVQEIPEHEKMDLFNSMHNNDLFFREGISKGTDEISSNDE